MTTPRWAPLPQRLPRADPSTRLSPSRRPPRFAQAPHSAKRPKEAFAGGTRRHSYVLIDDPSEPGFSGDGAVIVEPRLRQLVEIARPTPEFAALLDALPETFVGGPRQLETLVAAISVALQASFAASGLPLPPWRTEQAILAHWKLDRTVDGLARGGGGGVAARPTFIPSAVAAPPTLKPQPGVLAAPEAAHAVGKTAMFSTTPVMHRRG